MRSGSSKKTLQVGWTDELNLSVVGAAGHGKSTLVAALHRLLLPPHYAGPVDLTPPQSRATWTVECQKGGRLYRLRDFPRVPYFATQLLQEGVGDGAVLVVSAVCGPTEESATQLRLARDVGLRCLLVFLSHTDQVEDPELLQIAADETRALLQNCGWTAPDVPVLHGSAARALEGSREQQEYLIELIDTVDRAVPVPEEHLHPFLVEVENVYRFRRHGITVVGLLRQGLPWSETRLPSGRRLRRTALREVELLGPDFFRRVRVKSIVTRPISSSLGHLNELAGSEREPQSGDRVWLVPDGVDKEALLPARVAASLGAFLMVAQLDAVVCVPYEPDFPHMGSLRSGAVVVRHWWDTPATLTIEREREPLVAGDAARVKISFGIPVPFPVRGFHIVQGGEYVARGVVLRRPS